VKKERRLAVPRVDYSSRIDYDLYTALLERSNATGKSINFMLNEAARQYLGMKQEVRQP